jgi:CO/xanthine dehydrogenase Mo-binding subunit
VSFASIYTNRVPVTPYRGAGQPQAVFALERVMDLIARETGRDRAAVRFANFVQSADMPYDTGRPTTADSATSSMTAAITRRCCAARWRCRIACAPARRAGCSASASRATSS